MLYCSRKKAVENLDAVEISADTPTRLLVTHRQETYTNAGLLKKSSFFMMLHSFLFRQEKGKNAGTRRTDCHAGVRTGSQ